MSSGFLRIASFLVCAGSFVFLSCEKHHVGELPEVQRERGVENHSDREDGATTLKSEHASPAESSTPAGTPVDMFPEKKP